MAKKKLPGISKMLSITSLLYIMTASAGLIYSVLYYKEFSIDISNYIDLEESLLLFMPKIKAIGFFFVIFGLFAIMIFQVSAKFFKLDTGKSYIVSVSVLSALYLTAYVIAYIIGSDEFTRYRAMFFLTIPFWIFLFTLVLSFLLKWWKIKLALSGSVAVYILFMYTYGTWALCYLNVKTVKTFKKISCAHIFYNDGTPPVLATPENKYIGRTKNYIFLYDTASNEATVLSAENVQRIVMEK